MILEISSQLFTIIGALATVARLKANRMLNRKKRIDILHAFEKAATEHPLLKYADTKLRRIHEDDGLTVVCDQIFIASIWITNNGRLKISKDGKEPVSFGTCTNVLDYVTAMIDAGPADNIF